MACLESLLKITRSGDGRLDMSFQSAAQILLRWVEEDFVSLWDAI
jgi:hypothetical protein